MVQGFPSSEGDQQKPGEKHGTVLPLELLEATNLDNTLTSSLQKYENKCLLPRWWYCVTEVLGHETQKGKCYLFSLFSLLENKEKEVTTC